MPHRSTEELITEIEHYKACHVDWAEHFEQHPDIEAQYVATGQWDTAAEHRRIASVYEDVIEVLRASNPNRSK